MNRLNRKLEYALMSLQYFASKPEGVKVTAKDVCEVTGSPFDATARVMQLMAQKGLLHSEQGVKGGYVLSRDPSQVSFLELTEMILGPLEMAKCLGSPESCEIMSKCNIKTPINRLNNKMKSFFGALRLSEVLETEQRLEDVRL